MKMCEFCGLCILMTEGEDKKIVMRGVGSTQMHTDTHILNVGPAGGSPEWLDGQMGCSVVGRRDGVVDKLCDPSLMPSLRRPHLVATAAAAPPPFPR